jgi:exodeoxyribonuclease VII large subunit
VCQREVDIRLSLGAIVRFARGMPPPVSAAPVLSVSELTASVRRLLEGSIGQVTVEGEVSNYRMQSSGHQYFTLKDARSQVSCVWFSGRSSGGRAAALAEGMAVQVRGTLTVYEARGQYQINVQSVTAGGAGMLQAKFEALKQRLLAEGLFERARKRALPRYARTVALVTSGSGAALQDMLHVLGRRAPWVRVLVYSVRVQGEGAAQEVAEALEFINWASGTEIPEVDVIIAGRGGGSIEDLWAFNEEVVARAIAASQIPVVSAVGHETDFTIADFVADQRAPTPSAAAELVTPDGEDLRRHVRMQRERMEGLLAAQVRRWRQRVDLLEKSALFREPRNRLEQAAQRVDGAADRLLRAMRGAVERKLQRVEALAGAVRQHRPDQVLAMKRQLVREFAGRMERGIREKLRGHEAALKRLSELLVLLSPEATLERGYSITLTERGEALRSIASVTPGSLLVTRVRDGGVRSRVEAREEP